MDKPDHHHQFFIPPPQHQLCVPMMDAEQSSFFAGRVGGGVPEGGGGGGTAAGRGERKRRFTVDQIRSLESTFQAHHAKLEPREKAELARELGLQPRQVAIWFQNKRARWRSKQLEHDYAALKSNYDALHDRVESLNQEKLALVAQDADAVQAYNEVFRSLLGSVQRKAIQALFTASSSQVVVVPLVAQVVIWVVNA